MTTRIDRSEKEVELLLQKYLLNVQIHVPEIDKASFGDFFTERILKRYLTALSASNFPTYVDQHHFPAFEEEIPTPFAEIWKNHHHFIENLFILNDEKASSLLNNFMHDRSLSEFLIVIGQRITPASIQTFHAIPLPQEKLIAQAFIPYNREIKLAVRAWEKHVGRTETDFWGNIEGTPEQKEIHVSKLIHQMITDHYWWNVFEHFKHGLVYEIRVKQGHGIRWSITNAKFIGFVEPF